MGNICNHEYPQSSITKHRMRFPIRLYESTVSKNTLLNANRKMSQHLSYHPSNKNTHISSRRSTFMGPHFEQPVLTKTNSCQIKSEHSYEFMTLLGKGAHGYVYLAREIDTSILRAIKVLKKDFVCEMNLVINVLTEKYILKHVKCTFLSNLVASFQNSTHLFLVTEYYNGGDLFSLLQVRRKLEFDEVQKLVSSIVLGLEYLHLQLKVTHRDIKPENILIDSQGYAVIIDFGISKVNQRSINLCGTAEYLAPEIIMGIKYGREVDLWALGCMIYEIYVGCPPFRNTDRKELFKQILSVQYDQNLIKDDRVKEIVNSLLQFHPKNRLGFIRHCVTLDSYIETKEVEALAYSKLKNHDFFQGIDWEAIKIRAEKGVTIPSSITDQMRLSRLQKISTKHLSFIEQSNHDEKQTHDERFHDFQLKRLIEKNQTQDMKDMKDQDQKDKIMYGHLEKMQKDRAKQLSQFKNFYFDSNCHQTMQSPRKLV